MCAYRWADVCSVWSVLHFSITNTLGKFPCITFSSPEGFCYIRHFESSWLCVVRIILYAYSWVSSSEPWEEIRGLLEKYPTLLFCENLMDFNETRLLEVTLNPRVSIASVDGTQHLSEVVWSAFKIFTGKPTGKRPLGRPRRRWEDNIRMDLEEIGINAGNWVDSTQDRNYLRALVNAALNLRVP